jgi:hypothetical protein
MEHLLILIDRERRGLFSMKRAKPHKIFPRFSELNKLPHNRNNIGRLLYLFFGRLMAYHGFVFISCGSVAEKFMDRQTRCEGRGMQSADHKNA